MMPVGLMVPIQAALSATLPPSGRTDAAHQPFGPQAQVTICGLEDEVEVMASLQRPKKLSFLGSDGNSYTFLAKPKDDLRKDTRMMEFNLMLNRLLAKHPCSRRDLLYLRTFAVIPLTEECGLVQWVPNTRGIRHILQDLYEASGKFVRRGSQSTHAKIKQVYDKSPDPVVRMEAVVGKMMPPVFHRWLLQTFSEPGAWVKGRTAFTHTAAVWSMVGHVVGLGDRHGENLLLDGTSGDCVHVDFSCLFDKGLDLECPECVPFRCTQNMVDGFGVSGTEGVFINMCEIVLTVLRENKGTLMTVLETFIHDPLLEWTQKKPNQPDTETFSRRSLQRISDRLEGKIVGVGAAPSLPLGPSGQAKRLVEEATSWDNLGRMYIWWMPWF